MSTIQDALNRAADHIEKVGWHKGSMYKTPFSGGYLGDLKASELPCCLLGALEVVCDQPTASHTRSALVAECYHRINSTLEKRYYSPPGDPFYRIMWWNDHLDRTKQDVLDLLRGKL